MPSSQIYYPTFVSPIATRAYASGAYRFGFNGKEKDPESFSDAYDFGARIYDGRLGRWLSLDPLMKEYIPISAYCFSLSNPIYFTDYDGNVVIGADGNPVYYSKDPQGVIIWSENATSDIIKVGNAMLTTNVGEKQFNKWQNAATKVHVKIDIENEPNGMTAETKPYGGQLNNDGQYEEIEVTFFEKNINKQIQKGSGQRWEGASFEEALGAIGCHEVEHNDKDQIQYDLTTNEKRQDPKKNKPINIEIDFRTEYHIKKGITGDDWKKNYNKRGYNGTPKPANPPIEIKIDPTEGTCDKKELYDKK